MTTWLRTLVVTHESLIRTLGVATGIGLVLGALVGGVGGRVAMRVLFLTTGDEVRGVVSDDGFEIGQFSAATLNLVAAGAFFGLIGAYIYLAVRPVLIGPLWLRSATCAAAAGAVIGAAIVKPEGVDFTLLTPLELAVALFVLIPALFAGLLVPAVEHLVRPSGWAHMTSVRVATAPLAVFLFPPILVLVGPPVLAVLGVRWWVERSPRRSMLLRHKGVLWAARATWASVAVFGAALLIERITLLQ